MNIDRFSLIPAGSEDRASSRIRVYSLQRSLVAMGKVATLGYWAEADVLLIQKKLTRHVLTFAQAFRQKGGLVVYDVDDLGDALTLWAPRSYVHRMLQIAQLMTTDTVGHRDALAAEFGVKSIEVIPDCVDYYPDGPVDPKAPPEGPLRILWFGAFDGRSLDRYSKALSNLSNTRLVVITDQGSIKENAKRFKDIEFREWDRSNFIPILQSCHLSCLFHEPDALSLMKSNNRMIASITWGVPAVVSRTPEFARTAHEAGVDYAVFGNEEELVAAVDRLRDDSARRAYLRTAQPEIWRSYSPVAVAQRFLNVAEQYSASSLTSSALKSIRSEHLWQATCFRLRTTSEIAGEQFPIARRVIERGLWALRSRSLRLLFRPSIQGFSGKEPGAASSRDYRVQWIGPQAHSYSLGVYKRQSKAGTKPLVGNPTIDEVRTTLRSLAPDSVLEVGCGWGRLMEDLADEFNIQGCDVSSEMLARCKPGLKVFQVDIAVENRDFAKKNLHAWDVLFTRGVMLYFPEPAQLAYAMNNMLMLARKKIVIWEWPEVCDFMKRFSDSPKFDYHPIEHRNE